jgi:DHA1 family bicyclomycin/chloramphenicol resistance-like MFS transporter
MATMTITAQRAPVLAALVLVTGVGPLATDTYIAALPEVQRSLRTTPSIAQLTLTAFIIGLALGQLVFGPISDGRGRRRLLVGGAIAFTIFSGLCAVAPNGPTLVGLRLLEGVVGGCGVAIGRAVISDRYEGAAAAARYGSLAAITFLGPVLAPAIGGVILAVGDWRSVFVFLTAVGALMVTGVLLGIPETLPAERRHAGGLGNSLIRMKDLLRDRAFLAPVVIQCLATAGFFTYIGGSSFVLQEQLHFSQREYTVLFASNAAGMVVLSTVFGMTVKRFGAPALRNAGLAASAVAAAALAAYALLRHPDPPAVVVTWVLLAVVVAGMGLCIPGTTAIAQNAGRRSGGAASALQGGLTFTVGALATPLTGVSGHQTVLVMAALMALFLLCSVAALLVSRGRRS